MKEWQEIDQGTLETLRKLGITLVPIALPDKYPVGPLSAHPRRRGLGRLR